jgi:hypothetical protein
MGKYFPFCAEWCRLKAAVFLPPEPGSGLYTFENMAVSFRGDENGMALAVHY